MTAVADENDVHGVQQALVELARQLAEQAGAVQGVRQGGRAVAAGAGGTGGAHARGG
ncbi:hypothetical protein GTV15_20670 [Streptomyces sp. SID7803]|nr:hypothetical protein [Streptomyces sp. SID7803]